MRIIHHNKRVLQAVSSVFYAYEYVYDIVCGGNEMDVLERIKTLRDSRGWSNYRLAKEADIHEGTLNNLFRLNNQPTIPTLEAICNGLGITLAQFFMDDGDAVVLNAEQRDLLDTWNALNQEQKAALLEFLKKMKFSTPS